MMTYEEALNICRLAIRCFGNKRSEYVDENLCRWIVERNDLETMMTALEKQIPKKPNYGKYDSCVCINGHNIPVVCKRGNMPYCPFCGQAIDWSDE